MKVSSRSLLLVALSLSAMIAGAWLAVSQRSSADVAVATVYPAPRPLPDFELLDGSGAPLRSSDLHGRWSWLFFGFTHCPDVCPATLTVLANAVGNFDDTPPQVYLVTVDPERDTPDKLGPYVKYFNPDFHALTGTRAAIDELARQMFVAHAKVPLADGGYTMDHTSAIYFVDPDGQIVAVSTAPHDAAVLASDMRILQHRARL